MLVCEKSGFFVFTPKLHMPTSNCTSSAAILHSMVILYWKTVKPSGYVTGPLTMFQLRTSDCFIISGSIVFLQKIDLGYNCIIIFSVFETPLIIQHLLRVARQYTCRVTVASQQAIAS